MVAEMSLELNASQLVEKAARGIKCNNGEQVKVRRTPLNSFYRPIDDSSLAFNLILAA
jgi:hypothetical protein